MKIQAGGLNRGNFIVQFNQLMEHLNVRTRPSGLDTSIQPNRIIYETNNSNELQTLVRVPHFASSSSLGTTLIASGRKNGSAAVQNPASLVGALLQVQQAADEVTKELSLLAGRRDAMVEEGDAHVAVNERDAKAAGMKLIHEYNERLGWMVHSNPPIRVDRNTPLPSIVRSFNEDTWRHYFKAGLFYAAADAPLSAERAVAHFEWAAQTVSWEPARALIYEIGAALCCNTRNDYLEHDELRFETYGAAVNAWETLLSSDDHLQDRAVIMAAGIENSFAGGRFYAAKPFLEASIEYYAERPRIVAADHLRLAWAVLASTVANNWDDSMDWYTIADHIAHARDMAVRMHCAKDHVASLGEFAAAARDISEDLG